MKAIYYDGGRMSLREVPAPVAGSGEALVRVRVAGVCNTDVEIARGYMGFEGVPGHEFVGVVEECGDGSWVGKRVVGEINLACGACEFCRRGLGRHCPTRKVLGILGKDGAFAEFITLPTTNLHEVPESVSNDDAVFVEPVAACFEIIEQAKVAGKRVAVLGDGKLGILAARVLANADPAELALVGKHPEKLALAKSNRVETLLVDDFKDRVAAPARKYDLVVEATGRAEGFGHALDAVRPRGTIVLKTTVADAVKLDLARVVIDELTVIGSRCGPFRPAIEALAAGAVKVDDLVSARYPLEHGVKAVEAAMEPGALKVLVGCA